MQLIGKSFAGNIQNWRRVSRVSAARAIASGGLQPCHHAAGFSRVTMRRAAAVSPCGGLQPCHHAAGFSRVTMRFPTGRSPD